MKAQQILNKLSKAILTASDEELENNLKRFTPEDTGTEQNVYKILLKEHNRRMEAWEAQEKKALLECSPEDFQDLLVGFCK